MGEYGHEDENGRRGRGRKSGSRLNQTKISKTNSNIQHPTTTPHHTTTTSPLLPISIPRFQQKAKTHNPKTPRTHLRQKANLNTQCPTSSLRLSSSNRTFRAVLLDRGACCLTVADKSSRYCCGGRERSRSAWIWVRTIDVWVRVRG